MQSYRVHRDLFTVVIGLPHRVAFTTEHTVKVVLAGWQADRGGERVNLPITHSELLTIYCRLISPDLRLWGAALFKETTGKECVVYKCVAEHDVKIIPFDAWTQRTTEVRPNSLRRARKLVT
jgi:hypothetical protein